ncbi:MAG: DsrE family protein [Deltaproteobacteria bacterium]|nr:DsrE family protein [Deltaproteobacteria bacterium]
MKELVILLRKPPLERMFISEMLRMSLGMTLSGNRVKIVLAEEGVFLLQAPAPERIGLSEIHRHVRTLRELGCPFLAEKESMAERSIVETVFPVTRENRRTLGKILAGSDLVIGC